MFTTGPSLHTHTLPSVVFQRSRDMLPVRRPSYFPKTPHILCLCLSISCHGSHHWLRTASGYTAESHLIEHRMVCNKAFLAHGTVFCRYAYAPVLLNSSNRSKSFRNVPREGIQGLYRHRRVSCRNTAAEPHLRRLQQANLL